MTAGTDIREQGRNLLAGFLAHLSRERRLSPHTAEAYRRDVETLLELAGQTPAADLRPHHIRRFVAQLHGSGLDGRSLARMLSAWRGFYRYLGRDHGYQHNPCIDIRAPKSAKRLPHALSPDEAGQLLAAPAEEWADVRDRAMFELLYSSGLRLAELVGLAPHDVDWQDGTVRVTGKGSKTRVVPVGRAALDALQAWLEHRTKVNVIEPDALFLGPRGRRVAPRTVQERLKRWGQRQGLAANVHPHVLRHSFASHVLQSSGDLRAVQDMLGHASISTTQVYTQLDFQHLAKVYDAAHPRAKRKAK